MKSSLRAGSTRTGVLLGCLWIILLAGAASEGAPSASDAEFAVALPEGIRAVWDSAKAQRESTPTRERLCLNGLWRWQPAGGADGAGGAGGEVPVRGWGFFKVPGSWPGITDYMQKDSQTVRVHPAWAGAKLSDLTSAWYEREFGVPAGWAGRRISLHLDTLNSRAAVYVDGARVGEVLFPDGEVDLTGVCRPGAIHRLSLRVTALPLKDVIQSYTDSASAREVAGAVARRGLCGDVHLVGTPAGPRIREVKIETSVQRRELGVRTRLEGLEPGGRYFLRARVSGDDGGPREFPSPEFSLADLAEGGELRFVAPWLPAKLWDPGTPGQTHELELALVDGRGERRDVFWKERFGFREFRIEGRDFILNGRRIHLSAVPLDNAQVGAAWAGYAAARESLERLQSFGINFVYTHHYDCQPGAHLAFEEILRAADDVGMLVALSQPHFSNYDWKGDEADRRNGYARHADFYVRTAGNHPSVVMYAMSHNATGYSEDMNPDMIDGLQDARDTWAAKNVALARRAAAIVERFDPERIVYHHASGNLGPLHAINFYPNFAPIQELSDWFEHWETHGVKPVFLCEYGAPFTWDWTMYRGWYRDRREFGSAEVPWEFSLAEWNAQFLGDRAFPASEAEQANLRWESRQYRAGRLWHRWDYPADVGSSRFDERYPVFAAYITDNWRAFRARGVSATSPWEYGHFWKLREGVDRGRKTLPVDWEHLQRAGFSPDYLEQRYERMDLAYERADWVATPAAEALMRNNRGLLAFLGGAPAGITSKDHLFHPGEAVGKTVVVINDTRAAVEADASWTLELPEPVSGRRRIRVEPGGQERWPLRVELPATSRPGRVALNMRVSFDTGEVQEDRWDLEVIERPAAPRLDETVAVLDPVGETAAWLDGLGARVRRVGAEADLEGVRVLVIGRKALTVGGPAPDLRRVRDGMRVVLFEQAAEVLERRFGFRVAEYGLRQVFPRVAGHPLLAGLDAEPLLRDWRGAATLSAPRLSYESDPRKGPVVRWCGIPVPRLWRCGNRGNVASVLIEKPARGDFLPVVDGGFDLQYSPLLEYREGRGLVIFCQMDVTGRTESEPVAETLARNLLRRASEWSPAPRRRAVYAGDPAGLARIRALGYAVDEFAGGRLDDDQVLILGPGGPRSVAAAAGLLEDWRRSVGGRVLALGLDREDLDAWPGLKATVTRGEHLSTGLNNIPFGSSLAGIGPADVHLREPTEVPLVTGGVPILGNGVLASGDGTVFCQLVPWGFDGTRFHHLRRTERRQSVLLSRLVANLGVPASTPLLERFARPVEAAPAEPRWLEGFYLDRPEEWDDPYRFFRW